MSGKSGKERGVIGWEGEGMFVRDQQNVIMGRGMRNMSGDQ